MVPLGTHAARAVVCRAGCADRRKRRSVTSGNGEQPGNIDGLALAQWVHRSQADTRIILTSSTARTPGDVEEYASFLPKPYAEKDVERLLRSVLPSSQGE